MSFINLYTERNLVPFTKVHTNMRWKNLATKKKTQMNVAENSLINILIKFTPKT